MPEQIPFPTTLEELQKELLVHAQTGRSDALFRHAIASDQIGAMVRFLTHDPIENPTSRPHADAKSEVEAAGHAIVQLLTYVALRNINLQEAVNAALPNLREADFQARRPADSGKVAGLVACIGTGTIEAMAWVCKDKLIWPIGWSEPLILVIPHAEADSRLKHFAGILQDHGGMNCHAAIISREKGIPCIVGTGNATQKINTGDVIRMDTSTGIVTTIEESP